MNVFAAAVFCVLLNATSAWASAESRSIHVAPDVDVPVNVYGAGNPRLILWLPSEMGLVNADLRIAAQLSRQGFEVWVADLFSARFLPAVPSSLKAIPCSDVARLLRAAAPHHAQIYLLGSGHGAGLTLEGARCWQQHNPAHPINGVVLLFPNLYAGSPEPGKAPSYLPVASQTRLPIFILQGNLSPWYWHLDEMKATLEHGGSRVAIKILPGMRDRFYFRGDANPRERELGRQLAALITESIDNLPPKKRKTP